MGLLHDALGRLSSAPDLRMKRGCDRLWLPNNGSKSKKVASAQAVDPIAWLRYCAGMGEKWLALGAGRISLQICAVHRFGEAETNSRAGFVPRQSHPEIDYQTPCRGLRSFSELWEQGIAALTTCSVVRFGLHIGQPVPCCLSDSVSWEGTPSLPRMSTWHSTENPEFEDTQ